MTVISTSCLRSNLIWWWINPCPYVQFIVPKSTPFTSFFWLILLALYHFYFWNLSYSLVDLASVYSMNYSWCPLISTTCTAHISFVFLEAPIFWYCWIEFLKYFEFHNIVTKISRKSVRFDASQFCSIWIPDAFSFIHHNIIILFLLPSYSRFWECQ